MTVTSIILVGGASSRMGRNKALLPVGGAPLIERVIAAARPLSAEILLVADDAAPYEYLDLPVFPDLQAGRGPLMGLYSGLSAARHELTLLLACDMPFVSTELLDYLLGLSGDHDVVIPESPKGLHPLHAVYRRSTCIPVIAGALDAGKRRMISFLGDVRVRRAPERELRALDPLGVALMNVNTAAELAAAEHILRRTIYDEEGA